MYKDWSIDFVGIMASEEDLQRRPIIINSQNILQFFVKLISQTPDGFPNVTYFTVYSTELSRYGFEDDYYRPDDERKDKLERFLNDYLLVFHPQKKVLPNHNEIYVGKNVRLIRKSDSYLDGTTFLPVPVFSEDEHEIEFDDFMNKILNNRFIGRITNISTEINDTPQFVLWRQKDDRFKTIGEFDKHQYAHGGYCLYAADTLKVLDFQDEWLEDCYSTADNETLLFVPIEIYAHMSADFERATPYESMAFAEEARLQTAAGAATAGRPAGELDGHPAGVAAGIETSGGGGQPEDAGEQTEATGAGEAEAAGSAADSSDAAEGSSPSQSSPSSQAPSSLSSASSQSSSSQPPSSQPPQPESEEARFMEHFYQVTREMGLQYAEKDLYNFHTSMKSSTLNIIAGMSGTGKSRLVQAYARALGLDDDQFVIIPVRPSWTDDSDLIGYVDAMNMVYRPGDSGLVNTLIQAQREENRKSKLYLICFDEMNLARVEHYFSQFLSVLEMDAQRRFLRLYNDDLTGRLYNTAQYEPIIAIPENIMFVGTVNIDESTYHFSDKVLDRANVITLDVLPYGGLKHVGQKERKAPRELQARKTSYSFEEFGRFRNSEAFSLEERESEFFWELHSALQAANKNLGVGPRVVRHVDTYLRNLPDNPHIARGEALDLQVVQRVLTKLRGPEGLLKELIGKADAAGAATDGGLEALLGRYADISAFTETRKLLVHKAKELKINGYTI